MYDQYIDYSANYYPSYFQNSNCENSQNWYQSTPELSTQHCRYSPESANAYLMPNGNNHRGNMFSSLNHYQTPITHASRLAWDKQQQHQEHLAAAVLHDPSCTDCRSIQSGHCGNDGQHADRGN